MPPAKRDTELVELTTSNLPTYRDQLLELLADQMRAIGSPVTDCEPALLHAMANGPRTQLHLLLVDGVLAAFAFFNVCCGIESGGDYLWLNEIHVAAAHRGLGRGSQLLEHVSEWGRARGCRGILGVTGEENQASRGLFTAAGFSCSPVVWLSKRL